MTWFDVDKVGLAKLLEKRGKAFVVVELIQNAWDSDATELVVETEVKNKDIVKLCVKDNDPNGFFDLTHAFTLFAESEKKKNPEKRGRFNLGEKLVLAMCETASVVSTKGSYNFYSNSNLRKFSDKKTKEGSIFTGLLKMTEEEHEQLCKKVAMLIPPKNIKTVFNGKELENRIKICGFFVALPTEISDEEGNLKKTIRKTAVEIYEALDNEIPSIYELGIPVVETGDKWHINICQKIPLNFNRDNVSPGYLKTVRSAVLNNMHTKIDPDDSNSSWVRDAASDSRCSAAAIKTVMHSRFGKKVASFDPKDLEANKRAVSKGYVVIPGRSLSKGEWQNVKKANLIRSAGTVAPSPKPYSPDGGMLHILNPEQYTSSIKNIIGYSKKVAKKLLNIDLYVRIANEEDWPFLATYGNACLTLNIKKLGNAWFENGITKEVNELLIHEFAHHFCSDHLSDEYYNTLCKLGAELVDLALKDPKFFSNE